MIEFFLADTEARLASIITNREDVSARTPAIIVSADLSNIDFAVMKRNNDASSLQIPLYFMDDVERMTENPDDTRLKVTILVETEDENSNETLDRRVSFIIESHYLALTMALNAMPANGHLGGLPVFFMDSRKTINTAFGVFLHHVDFAIAPPMKESDEGVDFSQLLSTVVPEEYTIPLAPVAWDEVDHGPQTNPNLRKAQEIIFPIILGLSRDEPAALKALTDLEQTWDLMSPPEGVESDIETSELKVSDFEAFSMIISLLSNAYRKASQLNPIHQTAEREKETISAQDYDPALDISFSQIVSAPELNDVFRDVAKNIEPTANEKRHQEDVLEWNTPLSKTFPEAMSKVGEAFKSLSDYESYLNVLDIDFTDTEQIQQAVNIHGLGKTGTSLVLNFAAMVSKKVSMIEKTSTAKVPYAAIAGDWLTIRGDDYIWEIPSLTESLAAYSTQNAVDMFSMHANMTGDIDTAYYLWTTIHAIGHHITLDERWREMSNREFETRLTDLRINTDEFTKFKKWIVDFRHNILETAQESGNDFSEGDDDPCPVSIAMNKFVDGESEISVVPQLSEFAALTFPALADIDAKLKTHEFGSDKWSEGRKEYIHEFLDQISQIVGDRSRSKIVIR